MNRSIGHARRRCRGSSLLLALSLAGCAKSDEDRRRIVEGFVAPAPTDVPVTHPAPREPSPRALEELIEAAPRPAREPRVGGDATRAGSDTKKKEDPKRGPFTSDGTDVPPAVNVMIRTPWSSPALERASRAQLYWAFGRACRKEDGDLPPSESITLEFDIHGDGSVLPSSVSATTDDPALKGVAECIERVFLASGFTGPIEGRGSSTRVRVTWPSID
ncbi:MAG: hypothetical protein FJ096_08925 [Deltaproteobacteria bacterium]|nr:hypothetical protein [Deltaproteobacteria bacterium]